MNRDNGEEEFVEETEEVPQEALTSKEFLCTACFDVLAESELGKNKDNCPNCNETDCITER